MLTLTLSKLTKQYGKIQPSMLVIKSGAILKGIVTWSLKLLILIEKRVHIFSKMKGVDRRCQFTVREVMTFIQM